jgi:hypothetical protein
MMYSIYVLIDESTSEVRYVGKSKHVDNRMHRHMKEVRDKKCDTYKVRWMRIMFSTNRMIEVKIIETCTERRVNDREKYWIARLLQEGNRLTNATAGGEGLLTPSQETRDRMSKSISNGVRNAWQDPVYRAKQLAARKRTRHKTSESVRRLWQDPEYRKKMPDSISRSKSGTRRWARKGVRAIQSLRLKAAWARKKAA